MVLFKIQEIRIIFDFRCSRPKTFLHFSVLASETVFKFFPRDGFFFTRSHKNVYSLLKTKQNLSR